MGAMMATEYEFSARLVFWGDTLDWKRLADDLNLTVYESKTKGQPLKRADGTDTGSVAKTGRLSWDCSSQQPSLRRDPEGQLVAVLHALKQLAGPVGETYGVAQAELQLNVYYRDVASGEPDFMFPPALLELLVQNQIELGVTVLP